MNAHGKGALALALAAALSFGAIWGARLIAGIPESSGGPEFSAPQGEILDTGGREGICEAERLFGTDGETAGYRVTVAVPGYRSEITAEIRLDRTGETIEGVRILEQGETEQLGARIAEAEFLGQFSGVPAPVFLKGAAAAQEFGPLRDGEYRAEGKEWDGFTPYLRMTVEDGRITEVFWDEISADGGSKREMSERGEYVMTADGPTWAEQADALARALIESQSLAAIPAGSGGKTDAVSGVSISVGGFLSLAGECMRQASGAEEPSPEGAQPGTGIDAVSGATVSSAAVVKGVGLAYEFVRSLAG